MPIVQDKIKRISLIDKAIRTLSDPTKENIKFYVGLRLGKCSDSTVEKDIHYMRDVFAAPIKCIDLKYEYTDDSYEFWKVFMGYWGTYLDLPHEVRELINN